MLALSVAFSVALAAGVLVWFVPLQLQAHVRQHALHIHLRVTVKAPLVQLGRELNLSEMVDMAIEHMLRRWLTTGEPVKPPLQKTMKRAPRKTILKVLRRPLLYLGSRTRCNHLSIQALVGGRDAMESALLAGASWAVCGTAVTQFSRCVKLGPQMPRLDIRPNFREASCRVEADCILRLRLGHAIVAGVWLLRRALGEKELITWARDSWRRRGVEGDDRASYSGSDENSHGKS